MAISGANIDRLFRRPRRSKPPPAATLRAPAAIRETVPGARHVADVLYLPTDPNTRAKYALVVVDAATRATDAEPMRTKSAAATLKAFTAIHRRNARRGGIWRAALGSWPTVEGLSVENIKGQLDVDDGAEFKGEVRAAAQAADVNIHTGQPGRHQQQAMAETRNRIIGEEIGKLQAAREMITDKVQREWVADLPKIVENINDHLMRTEGELQQREAARNAVKPEDRLPVATADIDYDILPRGTRVHVHLPKDRPEDARGKRQTGNRRAGDPAFEVKVRTVEDVALLPGKPPLYSVSGRPNVYYRRWELMRADAPDKEEAMHPDGPKIATARMLREGDFVPYKLHGKSGRGRNAKWLVQWKGFPKREDWTRQTEATLNASSEGQRLLAASSPDRERS